MSKKGARIKTQTKTNKQDYTVGTVSTFNQKIIETGNRKRSLSGLGTCILTKGGRVILVYLTEASQYLLWNKCSDK
jgi:hypothetical protein